MSEAEAIVARYRRRAAYQRRPAAAPSRAEELMVAERSRAIRRWIAANDVAVANARLLDVGCGRGEVLQEFLELGFRAEHCAGADLIGERVVAARMRLPQQLRILCGDASELPWQAESVDVLLLFTVLSSIFDDNYRRAFAARLWKTVKLGGSVLVYDMCFGNPCNRDVRAVRGHDLRELFPAAEVRTEKLTLAPPLARAAVRFSSKAYAWLNWARPLRTHAFTALRKVS